MQIDTANAQTGNASNAAAADAGFTRAFRSHPIWLAIILAVALALRLAWIIFTGWQPLRTLAL